MDFKISVSEDVWSKARATLSASQIALAMRMAINEGLTRGRTEVRRGIQSVYNLKTSVLTNDKTGLKIKKATNSDLSGTIHAPHKPLPIALMDVQFKGKTIGQSFTRAKKGRVIKRSISVISVEVIRGERKAFATAFVPGRATNKATGMQHFTRAIFARGKRGKPGFDFGKKRMPIDTISTVSPGTAAANARTVDIYEHVVKGYAEQRFKHHIERLVRKVDGLE